MTVATLRGKLSWVGLQRFSGEGETESALIQKFALLNPKLFARSLESDAIYDQTGLQYHPRQFLSNMPFFFNTKKDYQTKDIFSLGPKDTVSAYIV